jgi:hypothetical protein
MEDQDDGLFGSFTVGLEAETDIPFTDEGIGQVSLGSGPDLVSSFTDYVTSSTSDRGIDYGIDFNLPGDPDSFPAVIDADGNISLSFPFEENLDDGGPGGPEFGTRSPPGTLYLKAVANGNTYIFKSLGAEVGYGTIDTNNDGVLDALNPDDRQFDSVAASLSIVLKQGSGMTAASLNGDFGFVSLATFLGVSPTLSIFESIVGENNLNNGTVTIQDGGQDTRQVIRTPVTLTDVTLTDNVVPEGAETFSYTVSDTGQVMFGIDTIPHLANDDGSVMAFVNSEAEGSPIDFVGNSIVIQVRLGTNMAASLDDATYQLFLLAYVLRTDGYSNVHTLGHGSVGVFNADATTFSVNGTDRGFSRDTDLAQISPFSDPIDDFVFTVDSIAANGALTMSVSDGTGTDTLKGFVSSDGNLLILRALSTDPDERNIGLLIGVKQ